MSCQAEAASSFRIESPRSPNHTTVLPVTRRVDGRPARGTSAAARRSVCRRPQIGSATHRSSESPYWPMAKTVNARPIIMTITPAAMSLALLRFGPSVTRTARGSQPELPQCGRWGRTASATQPEALALTIHDKPDRARARGTRAGPPGRSSSSRPLRLRLI